MIHPIPNEAAWPKVEVDIVLPAQKKRLPRRPKVCKRRELNEPRKEKKNQ